jgi:hypothetical protein
MPVPLNEYPVSIISFQAKGNSDEGDTRPKKEVERSTRQKLRRSQKHDGTKV